MSTDDKLGAIWRTSSPAPLGLSSVPPPAPTRRCSCRRRSCERATTADSLSFRAGPGCRRLRQRLQVRSTMFLRVRPLLRESSLSRLTADRAVACWLSAAGQRPLTECEPVPDALLAARGLTERYALRRSWSQRRQGTSRALDGMNLGICNGEAVGVVGESGCGKSTLGRCLIRLLRPTTGEVLFQGERIDSARGAALKELHRHPQMIFQDPVERLDPRMRTVAAAREGLDIQGIGSPAERRARTADMLGRADLPAAMDRYYPRVSSWPTSRPAPATATPLAPRRTPATDVGRDGRAKRSGRPAPPR